MKKLTLLSLSIIFCFNIINAQSYCLTINTTENGLIVTFNWSITTNPIQSVAASIDIIGEGTLVGQTETVGGFGSSSYSGSFNLTKSGPGPFTFSKNDSDPLGVISSSTFSRLSFSCSLLPITLTTFSATKQSERASKLDWTTSSEINSAYFGIERSRDGDTWETIDKVTAAGNSFTELTYEYIDDRLPFSRTADQIYYYRLRLTDQDGSHKYSDIKDVNFSRKTSDGIAIYPNPSTQMVHLDISTMDASAGEIDLRIYDIHGRIMIDKQIIGSGIEPIDVTQYPTGTYQVSVTQGTTQHQKRFIKIE